MLKKTSPYESKLGSSSISKVEQDIVLAKTEAKRSDEGGIQSFILLD
jgi:hypothetical protein